MRIETSISDTLIRIKLIDRMSFSDHGNFRDMLEAVKKAAPQQCILDMSGLTSVDSAALGMLMIAHEASKKGGWQLELTAPKPNVRKLLELAHFDKILTVT
ncbi:SpoIIAA Anti-anti-sigma regulatory factor (antagonist of anti-sigma factor) [Rhabdaerophilaceae bacterium]